jgi:hypothetical protein
MRISTYVLTIDTPPGLAAAPNGVLQSANVDAAKRREGVILPAYKTLPLLGYGFRFLNRRPAYPAKPSRPLPRSSTLLGSGTNSSSHSTT